MGRGREEGGDGGGGGVCRSSLMRWGRFLCIGDAWEGPHINVVVSLLCRYEFTYMYIIVLCALLCQVDSSSFERVKMFYFVFFLCAVGGSAIGPGGIR